MRRWVIHLLMMIVGASLGTTLLPVLEKVLGQRNSILDHGIFDGLIGAIIFLILSFLVSGMMIRGLNVWKMRLRALIYQSSCITLLVLLSDLLSGFWLHLL